MSRDSSYLTERLAERRRRVRSGIAGVALLMSLGLGLLWSYPAPLSMPTAAMASGATASAEAGPQDGPSSALR
jgi:hypothetical protein